MPNYTMSLTKLGINPDLTAHACHAQEKLPAANEGGEPLPEGLLWLLMTGDVRCSMLARVSTAHHECHYIRF